jgi:hypothetical protein
MVHERESLSPFGNVLFPHIFRSFRMAVQPSKLAIAFAALTIICVTGWLMDLNRTVVLWPRDETTELDAYLNSQAVLRTLLNSPQTKTARTGVFSALCKFADTELLKTTGSLVALDIRQFLLSLGEALLRCGRAAIWAFQYHTAYSVVFFSVVLATLSMAGGAICRIAALEFARSDRTRISQAYCFVRRRFPSLLAAPIGPVVIALLLGLPIVLLGLLGNIPYVGELLTGLLLPLALILAPFIVVILIGAAGGFSLLFPAIAYEDSDFFDAISRCVSSVYAKPWRLAFYTLTAAIYGAVCYLFIRFFTFALLGLTYGLLQAGIEDGKLQTMWTQPTFGDFVGAAPVGPKVWSLALAAVLIRIWVLAVTGLMVSYLLSFYFTAGTIIYALMRNRVDGTGLDEVYVAPEEEAPALAQTDLPAPGAATTHVAESTTATSE